LAVNINLIIFNLQKLKSQRYRFSLVVNDLQSSKNTFYKTSLLCFANALINYAKSLKQRIQVRNEFIGEFFTLFHFNLFKLTLHNRIKQNT